MLATAPAVLLPPTDLALLLLVVVLGVGRFPQARTFAHSEKL